MRRWSASSPRQIRQMGEDRESEMLTAASGCDDGSSEAIMRVCCRLCYQSEPVSPAVHGDGRAACGVGWRDAPQWSSRRPQRPGPVMCGCSSATRQPPTPSRSTASPRDSLIASSARSGAELSQPFAVCEILGDSVSLCQSAAAACFVSLKQRCVRPLLLLLIVAAAADPLHCSTSHLLTCFLLRVSCVSLSSLRWDSVVYTRHSLSSTRWQRRSCLQTPRIVQLSHGSGGVRCHRRTQRPVAVIALLSSFPVIFTAFLSW